MKTISAVLALLLVVTSVCDGQSFKGRTLTGEAAARAHVRHLLKNEAKPVFVKALITDKVTATAVAEAILFNMYGKENIVRQRPYEVYLVDGYWYVAGTLPEDWKGGVFETVISAATSEVIEVTHGK